MVGEWCYGGQVMFVVESDLLLMVLWYWVSLCQCVEVVFVQLCMWDIEYNNGVLVYLLLVDYVIELVVDCGLCGWIGQVQWQVICVYMQVCLCQGELQDVVLQVINEVFDLLVGYYLFGIGLKDDGLFNIF